MGIKMMWIICYGFSSHYISTHLYTYGRFWTFVLFANPAGKDINILLTCFGENLLLQGFCPLSMFIPHFIKGFGYGLEKI